MSYRGQLTRPNQALVPTAAGGQAHVSVRPRLLLVESHLTDARMIEGMLRAAGCTFEVVHVGTLAEAKGFLEVSRAACVLMDLTPPDADAMAGLVELRVVAPEVPVVVVTDDEDQSRGVQALRAGAQDYLMKGRTDAEQLARALRFAIERQRGELLLAHRALHDPLTGLPNRTLFLDRLALALGQSARQTVSVAVLFVDLNGFKSINDRFGHAAGDAVLQSVATRLLSSLRPGDTAARYGGDEFTILGEEVAQAKDAARIAERLVEGMSAPFEVGSGTVTMSASIGITLANGRARDADTVVNDADGAMYRAKQQGSSAYVVTAP